MSEENKDTGSVCIVCKSRRINQDTKWEDNECLNCGKIWTTKTNKR